MSITLNYQHSPVDTVRAELLRMITQAIEGGSNFQSLKNISRPASNDLIGRAIGITGELVGQCLKMHEMFEKSFGPRPLAERYENVLLEPFLVLRFLREPAALQLASEISGMTEARIQRILNLH